MLVLCRTDKHVEVARCARHAVHRHRMSAEEVALSAAKRVDQVEQGVEIHRQVDEWKGVQGTSDDEQALANRSPALQFGVAGDKLIESSFCMS
jgi:hypothetical protein